MGGITAGGGTELVCATFPVTKFRRWGVVGRVVRNRVLTWLREFEQKEESKRGN